MSFRNLIARFLYLQDGFFRPTSPDHRIISIDNIPALDILIPEPGATSRGSAPFHRERSPVVTPTPEAIDALLPLPTAAFHILLVLSVGERHGYGIMQDVEAMTGGAVRLSPGTLYRTIQRLLEQGLIEESRASSTVDPRRRPYGVTAFGRAVARAESSRLAELVRLAEGAGLLPEPS